MKNGKALHCATGLLMCVLAGLASAAEKGQKAAGPACDVAGPQTPRDIDKKEGSNKVAFEVAPAYKELNLCNIHFHAQAEHKAADYSVAPAKGDGFACAMSQKLTPAEIKAPAGDVCKGLKPGDTIEMHWVHSSCDVKPGPGLGSCVAEACKSPKLRVEAQVFTLVNDPKAAKLQDMVEAGQKVGGKHQAKSIPSNTGKPVQFPGSTTGPSYDDKACSPAQATWSVRPQCAKLDINSVAAWCKSGNVFAEDHAHGVRKLVTNPRYLAPIPN